MSHDILLRNLPLTTGHDPWLENEDHTRSSEVFESKSQAPTCETHEKSQFVVWNRCAERWVIISHSEYLPRTVGSATLNRIEPP